LAAEFQMYLIAPMAIISLRKYKKLLIGAILAMIVGITIFRAEVLKEFTGSLVSASNDRNM
jgi:peptidoglycan/LPS O-acetylase OafA/YrhL